MKSKNRNQGHGEGDNRAQLILIGGLVIAVVIIAIALVIGGGIFSQLTNDDGGLSRFTSQTSDQLQSAAQVSQQDLEYLNENSTLFQGAYPDELCGKLVNSTSVQQFVSTQLGEGESVVSIEVEEDCGDDKSWVVGQKNPNYNLPSVNATDQSQDARTPADVVFAIDRTGSMDSSTRVTKPIGYKTPSSGVFPSEDLTNTYRSDTLITIPKEWIETRSTGSWSGNTTDPSKSIGDIVTNSGCSGFGCDIANITGYAGSNDWNVNYDFGGTATVSESNLDEMEYRLNAPERMWFTQKGLKNALGDLNQTKPDRAGLIGYNASQSEEASVRGIDDASHRDIIKEETDKFLPDGGTDIAGAVDEGEYIVDRDYNCCADGSGDATKNIVVMTDGQDTTGADPVTYINNNNGDFDDTYIHSVVLGSSAADNPSAVGDMAELANDPDPDLDKSSLTESDLPSCCDPVRPNGTLIASNDPADAEDIFKTIIQDIGDISDSAQTSSTGEVDNIYDVRMNVTDFQGNGTYRMRYENGSSGNVIWGMVVDNKFPSQSSYGYKVDFYSDVYNSPPLDLNETVDVVASKGNLSKPDNYVWLDLTGKGSKDRLDVGGLSTTQTANDLTGYSDPDNYIEDAWGKVEDEANSGGVNIVVEHRGPNGASNPPFRRGEVNGTFAMEFEPEDGDFTEIGQISGGNFTDDCSTANATNLPTRCGLNDNNRSAVSTTQIKEVNLLVTVEGPDGVSEREITIPPEDEEFSFDLFGS